MSDPNLDAALRAYSQRGVAGLEALVSAGPPGEAWLDTLLVGLGESRSSVVASWLLRAYLQREVELSKAQSGQLLRTLEQVRPDDARLHLCQCVRHLDIPTRNAGQLARFLRSCAQGSHAFTRAWAVDAFQWLARQHPSHRREASLVLERATRDPKASVRARVRRILRERPS